ncbi:MAG TPA: ribosome small subunit-dependent GTPase A [Clostridiales bacterium]|nr:ribosome small subunit-dependent GTPase A [Clostridiales bacterium]
METINLREWGLDDFIVKQISQSEIPNLGRIVTEGNKIYKIITEEGLITGEVSGKAIYDASGTDDFPAVGDWVLLDRVDAQSGNAIILKVLQRKSKLSRKVAGKRFDEQIIATNIDTIFITMSVNNDFNIRRLERYLTIVWDSMAVPVILLTKVDLCQNIDSKMLEIEAASPGVDILTTSAVTGEGIQQITTYLGPGKTVAFVGSSGVGKSSIINYLKGEKIMAVKDLRNDDKGRHTTTHRQLVPMSSGGVIIDTPGMREIQIMDVDTSLDKTFTDVETLAKNCKFNNCQHQSEPGCAIREALEDGTLDRGRWDNYIKMKKEIEYFIRKTDKKAESEYWNKIKKRSKLIKEINSSTKRRSD